VALKTKKAYPHVERLRQTLVLNYFRYGKTYNKKSRRWTAVALKTKKAYPHVERLKVDVL
jgi:hypothetical protein